MQIASKQSLAWQQFHCPTKRFVARTCELGGASKPTLWELLMAFRLFDLEPVQKTISVSANYSRASENPEDQFPKHTFSVLNLRAIHLKQVLH